MLLKNEKVRKAWSGWAQASGKVQLNYKYWVGLGRVREIASEGPAS